MSHTIRPNKYASHSNMKHSKKVARRAANRVERRVVRQYKGDDVEDFGINLRNEVRREFRWQQC